LKSSFYRIRSVRHKRFGTVPAHKHERFSFSNIGKSLGEGVTFPGKDKWWNFRKFQNRFISKRHIGPLRLLSGRNVGPS
jgi:hypothetical protein